MILIVALAAILFLLSLITRRRFGVLGLALCAGSLLSGALASQLASVIEGNLSVEPLSDIALASAILVLLPSLLLLFGGPKYTGIKGAVIGSAGYALLAVLLLLGPLSGSLSFDTASRDLLQQIARYESFLIAGAVVLAVFDMWLTHMPKLGKEKKRH